MKKGIRNITSSDRDRRQTRLVTRMKGVLSRQNWGKAHNVASSEVHFGMLQNFTLPILITWVDGVIYWIGNSGF